MTTAAPSLSDQPTTAQPAAPDALAALAALPQVALEAGLSANRQELYFRVLNRTVAYCPYARAVLWDLRGRAPRLLGVSGQAAPAAHAALVADWRAIVCDLPRDGDPLLLGPGGGLMPAGFDALARRTGSLSVVWLPIRAQGRVVAALWLERWSGQRFTRPDVERLTPLALFYGVAWRSVAGQHAARWTRRRGVMGAAAALVVAGIAAALAWIPVPLRIVAPCEVVPADPVAIAAPLDGVIDSVTVLPGRRVAAGDLLAVYDKQVATEELRVAEQQVQVLESDLQRARVQAFDDPTARAQIALLENQLAQERTRLRMAQQRFARLEIRAPNAGVTLFADPHAWQGRPVRVGERILSLVDPQHTKVRVWLPEHDNVTFDPHRPATIVLDADPRTTRQATLTFVANHSETTRGGVTAFRAEADWATPPADLKLGLQGSAVLYGDDVSLGYWLLRRPLSAVRRYFGI